MTSEWKIIEFYVAFVQTIVQMISTHAYDGDTNTMERWSGVGKLYQIINNLLLLYIIDLTIGQMIS